MPHSPIKRVSSFSRRGFLRGVAAGGALSLLPAASWRRMLGANERLRVAVIGTGGMGMSHVNGLVGRKDKDNVDVVRVCDVYRRRLNGAVKAISGKDGSGTMEYREVIDDRDVDAVVIATPDHWHTKIAIEAMDAGKDVYCEKPLSLTIEQALACRNAVRRTKRTLQVGPQRTSEDRFWRARDAIAMGRIGKPVWSQGAYCRNSREGQFNWTIDPSAGPKAQGADHVWWDRWLGHEWGLAEEIPWNADHFFRFRKYWAYNGGVATDLLYHVLAPLLLAITGPDGEYPSRVSAAGGRFVEKDERDIPDTFMMTVDYPSEHTVMLVSVMTNDDTLPTVIRGQHGTMTFGDKVVISEQGAWAKEFRATNADRLEAAGQKDPDGGEAVKPGNGKAVVEIDQEPRRDHMGNFIDAVRGLAIPTCNVELGCSTMVAIKMAVEAYRSRKTLSWDAAKEAVIAH